MAAVTATGAVSLRRIRFPNVMTFGIQRKFLAPLPTRSSLPAFFKIQSY